MKETYDIKTTLLLIVCKASELCLASHFVLFFNSYVNPGKKQVRISFTLNIPPAPTK